MPNVKGLVKEAISLYAKGRIDEAEGRLWSAYLENLSSGGRFLPIYEDDLKRAGVTKNDFLALLKDTGIPLL